MTQEEKSLLLKDLCARLPYGVKMTDGVDIYRLTSPFLYKYIEMELKPYLRPMSSMTEDEKENLQLLHDIISDENYGDGYSPSAWDAITKWEDYCNSKHFDYRGLIEKGLALEAPKGMYNLNKE